MRSVADTGLIMVVLVLGALLAGSGIRETWMSASTERGRDGGADSRHGLSPRSRTRPVYWVLVLGVWGAAALAAAVLGWATYPGETRALALAAMLTAVVSRLVVTVLFITPIVLSQQPWATSIAEGAMDLYRPWQIKRTVLDAIAFLVTAATLFLAINASSNG